MNKKNVLNIIILIILILTSYYMLLPSLAKCEETWPTERWIQTETPSFFGFNAEKFYLINGKSTIGRIMNDETNTISIYYDSAFENPRIDKYLPSLFSGIERDTKSYYDLALFSDNATLPFVNKFYKLYNLELNIPHDLIAGIEGKSPLYAALWATGLGWFLPVGHYYTNDESVQKICNGMKLAFLGIAGLAMFSAPFQEGINYSFYEGIAWVEIGLFAGSWFLDIADAPFSAMRHNDMLKKKYNLPVGISVKSKDKEVKISYQFNF